MVASDRRQRSKGSKGASALRTAGTRAPSGKRLAPLPAMEDPASQDDERRADVPGNARAMLLSVLLLA